MLCTVGDCGNIVIFAIFAKFASIANFYGAPSLLCALPCWRFWQNCHFCHICQIRQYRQLLWGPLIALCFAMLAILAKLSFLPYLPNSPVSPTFMGPPHCFVLCHVGDSGKIVIFAIFSKFASIANFYGPLIALCFAMLAILAKLSFLPYIFAKFASIANFYGAPSLLCALPCWRFWQYCHFRHTVEPRLSGLVGTSVKSPDNRKYEY